MALAIDDAKGECCSIQPATGIEGAAQQRAAGFSDGRRDAVKRWSGALNDSLRFAQGAEIVPYKDLPARHRHVPLPPVTAVIATEVDRLLPHHSTT